MGRKNNKKAQKIKTKQSVSQAVRRSMEPEIPNGIVDSSDLEPMKDVHAANKDLHAAETPKCANKRGQTQGGECKTDRYRAPFDGARNS